MLVQGHIAQALERVVGIKLLGSDGCGAPVGALADASGARMTPVNDLEGTHLLARIKDNFLAAGGEDHEVVIELIEVEIKGCEDPLLAIDHAHVIGGETDSAEHGEVEESDVPAVAASLRPGVLGALGHLYVELLQL